MYDCFMFTTEVKNGYNEASTPPHGQYKSRDQKSRSG